MSIKGMPQETLKMQREHWPTSEYVVQSKFELSWLQMGDKRFVKNRNTYHANGR